MGVTSSNPKFWSHSSKVIRISTLTLIIVCLYFGLHFILIPVFDFHLENLYNVCVHYDENIEDSETDHEEFLKNNIDQNLLLEMALVGIPTIAVTSATPILDAVTYRIVSGWISNSFSRRAEIQARVPRRTIIISSILALIIFVGKLITFFGFNAFPMDTWITLTFAIGHLIITIRNPIISLFSHEVNSHNRSRNHRTEMRRFEEILDAQRHREERRALLLSDVSSISTSEKRSSKATQTEFLAPIVDLSDV